MCDGKSTGAARAGMTAAWVLFAAAVIALSTNMRTAHAAARHPNLLLNAAEIEQVKAKIKREPWAAKLLDRVRELADDNRHTSREPRDAALVYALGGERRYADAARQAMLGRMRGEMPNYEKLDLKADPSFGSWGPWAQWAWAYDLTYDTFSDNERQSIEQFLRTVAHTIVDGAKIAPTTQGLVFEKHWKVALIGYCLGDQDLIDWGMHDPGAFGAYLGGVYTALDANVRDELFWSESPHYGMGTVLHGFLAVAEAQLHYDGTDLYQYRSPKSGGSIKGMFDGYLRITYPRERTGINEGSLRLVTYGDGSTGYTPTGQQTDTFLINPVAGGPKRPVTLNGEFEIAYKRFHDPGYAWVVGLNPNRDGYIGGERSIWGYAALTHGEPLPEHPQPPPAPSGVYASQGVAVLRADESPAGWTNDTTTAVLRLGSAVGHGHNDYFHLLLHGKGRLLYPTIQLIQYEPNYLGWTREGIACNTLLVDHQSPRPGPVTTRQDFAPEAKYFAVSGSAFENVSQTRALFLTPQYVADIFRAADENGRARTFDWVLHGLGRLFPGNPAAYRTTHELTPFYWWIENERGRSTDAAWQADWVQHNAGVIPGAQPFGKDWFGQTAGVRMTMLGRNGTEIYCGDGPIVDGPPYALLDGHAEGSVPLIVARRQGPATTFAAVHEPYDHRPTIRRVSRIDESDRAVGIAVEADGFSDRLLFAFAPDADQTLGASGESFTFRDHVFVRRAAGQIIVRGNVITLRLRLAAQEQSKSPIHLVLNGKTEPARINGDFVVFGAPKVPDAAAAPPAAEPADAAPERNAALHYSFLPQEVHLKAGDERPTTLHLRCVGTTSADGMKGRLRFVSPKGISVEPNAIDLAGMHEGDEKDVSLSISSEGGLTSGLYPVAVAPTDGAVAASGELPVSVGVVVATDRRLALLPQLLVRAPGYTIRVDHRSGTAYFLLDADGHRRHGHIGDVGTGFFAVSRLGEREFTGDSHGRWAFHYRLPCRFVFDAKNDGTDALLLVSGGQLPQVRLRYTFYEDRIVARLVQPTDPREQHEMWLSEFDALGEPLLNPAGTEQHGKETAVISDGVFFPHPLNRQGLLITLPQKVPICSRGTSVHFTIRMDQDVTLRFAEPNEVPASFKAYVPSKSAGAKPPGTDKKKGK